jgi:hypothetical protein
VTAIAKISLSIVRQFTKWIRTMKLNIFHRSRDARDGSLYFILLFGIENFYGS